MSRLPFLDGFCRGLAAGLVVLVILLASTARAEEWRRVALVESPAITVTVATEAELARLRAKHERADRSALGRVVPMHRYGFAILYRDTSSGAYRCTVFVRDAGDAATLEHELRHCEGWAHD